MKAPFLLPALIFALSAQAEDTDTLQINARVLTDASLRDLRGTQNGDLHLLTLRVASQEIPQVAGFNGAGLNVWLLPNNPSCGDSCVPSVDVFASGRALIGFPPDTNSIQTTPQHDPEIFIHILPPTSSDAIGSTAQAGETGGIGLPGGLGGIAETGSTLPSTGGGLGQLFNSLPVNPGNLLSGSLVSSLISSN
jgi:hypothetical protein